MKMILFQLRANITGSVSGVDSNVALGLEVPFFRFGLSNMLRHRRHIAGDATSSEANELVVGLLQLFWCLI